MPAAPAAEIRLSTGGPPIPVRLQGSPESEAMRWSYVARSRDRWTSGRDPGEGASGPLHDVLSAADLARIAQAPLVELRLRSDGDERRDWPWRVFPWEYALSAATRGLRSGPFTVVRFLDLGGRPDATAAAAAAADVDRAPAGTARAARERRAATPRVSMARPALLATLPSPLDRLAGPDSAQEALAAGLPPGRLPPTLWNPSPALATRWLEFQRPTVLHLKGIDNHQAAAWPEAASLSPVARRRDGLVFRRDDAAPGLQALDAEGVATLACTGRPAPDLVVCDFFNSAARVASRCLAHGARFALGYHDVIDPSVASLFLLTLYRQLARAEGDVRGAFLAAMETVRLSYTLRGAGLVLWCRESLLSEAELAAPVSVKVSLTSAAPPLAAAPKRGTVPPVPTTVPAGRRLRVDVDVKAQVNYSLLHNRQSLFNRLQIIRGEGVEGEIGDVRVTVDLHAGDQASPYARTLSLPAGVDAVDLSRQVVLPLTSSLIRTQGERIQSSLRVRVTCDQAVVYEDTFRVGLSPVDEWQDGDVDEWRWLPSFVLPRDPAVARVMDAAQGLLCALADDPAAGFDGYQSIDREATGDARHAGVDLQVRAIWWALLDSWGVGYINPPPSYGAGTQRLRTPSQVLAQGRGTCIDLALMLAACLEYIDVYPVLFLLQGHAFAGYWRSDEDHAAFLQVERLGTMFAPPGRGEAPASSAGALPTSVGPGYVLASDQHREVRQRVNARQIVPLEATWLTCRGGFDAAVTEGMNNLRRAAEFAAMIDVRLARARGVTPLPLIGAP